MSFKTLLAKVSRLAKLKVVGVGKYTIPIGECGKCREGGNYYEH